MTNIITSNSRITRDSQNDAIRTWFDVSLERSTKESFKPRDLAKEVLRENAKLFNWKQDLNDFLDYHTNKGSNVHSVRFVQEFKGVPVDSSEVVVNIVDDGRVESIYNHYHYDIPAGLEPKKIKFNEDKAREIINGLLGRYRSHEVRRASLIVYQFQQFDNHPHQSGSREDEVRTSFLSSVDAYYASNWSRENRPKEGQYFLSWDFVVTTVSPKHSWRILIDAMTGKVIQVIDLFQYATGAGRVFDPNPIVVSGNTGLSSTTAVATLNGLTKAVVFDRLNAADGAGNLHLDGAYAHMSEIENPLFAEPVDSLGDFIFAVNDRNFLAGMCYYHIDQFQNYIQTTLGLTNVANFSIPVDPQGESGADNSRYDPVAKDLAFGEGGIADAADAYVILHEYGHAIQDNVNPGYGNGNYSGGTSEGFGDFLAAIYYDDRHANPSATRGATFPWDANTTDNFWSGRRYDVTWLFDGPEFSGASGHNRGQLWCAALFELYRKLGGDSGRLGVKHAARDLIIRLHLMANFNVPSSGATAQLLGQQIEAADGNLAGWNGLANGLHTKVIYDTFRRRHMAGYTDLPVDVYVNDGRNGGYGSLSGNDLFTENLWDENYWDTQDIWVKTVAYASPADQSAGGPADHIEPPVDSPAYLYTRVKNRGTNAAGSGPVTVRAFHCAPGIGLVWPDDWTEMDATQVTQPANVLPGTGNGQIVGPFVWTPDEVGHECVLVIVECANDRAVTETLASTAHVEHSNLVPFDNNLAQRNLAPTSAKGKMKRGFYVRNPETEVRIINLDFESRLPEGWSFHTNVVDPKGIRLGPLEKRWVEVIIDQNKGKEVTTFEKNYTLTVVGTIDDKVIGGMTFYVAPPSAFGTKPTSGPGTHEVDVHHNPNDLFCLNIPWKDCEFEGELDIKIKFRKK